MEFRHGALGGAALSDEMIKLTVAAERIGAGPDPINELHKIDCVPGEVRVMAGEAAGGSRTLNEVSADFERTRARLLRKWRGDAADAFAASSLNLLRSYIAARRRASDTAQAGVEIAGELDEIASWVADRGMFVARHVEPACDIVITQTDEGLEEAVQAVREAVETIADLVHEAEGRIAGLGSLLARI